MDSVNAGYVAPASSFQDHCPDHEEYVGGKLRVKDRPPPVGGILTMALCRPSDEEIARACWSLRGDVRNRMFAALVAARDAGCSAWWINHHASASIEVDFFPERGGGEREHAIPDDSAVCIRVDVKKVSDSDIDAIWKGIRERYESRVEEPRRPPF